MDSVGRVTTGPVEFGGGELQAGAGVDLLESLIRY